MNYEKKYKEALERARECLKDGTITNVAIGYIEDIFPELAESDDERIRKGLIALLKFGLEDGSAIAPGFNETKEQALAWLEKQGETFTKRDVDDAYLKGISDAKNELEKQGEQKPADNVEPKFKVGDWITDGEAVFHITSYSIDYGYQLETPKGTSFHFSNENVENKYHIWTIQDAKDGDVLYLQHDGKEHIIIYKGIIKERFRTFVSAYCAYNGIVDDFCFADVSRYADIAYGGIMPATKEQRDLLFAKMKEAGYMWDAKKKELRNSNEFNCGGNPREIQ